MNTVPQVFVFYFKVEVLTKDQTVLQDVQEFELRLWGTVIQTSNGCADELLFAHLVDFPLLYEGELVQNVGLIQELTFFTDQRFNFGVHS